MNTGLEGKTVLVVESVNHFGRPTAVAFAKEGANLVLASAQSSEALEETARQVSDQGVRVITGACATGNSSQLSELAQRGVAEFGHLDVLVNNAGRQEVQTRLEDITDEQWEKTFATNLTTPLVWTQACWNAWMKEHGGAVINVSSVGAYGTNAILGVYDLTKRALIHLTEQLAAEMGPKVRVNAVCPGLIRTDFARALWEDGRGEAIAQNLPMKRLGEPEDMACLIAFLASPLARYITGEVIHVDGGMRRFAF